MRQLSFRKIVQGAILLMLAALVIFPNPDAAKSAVTEDFETLGIWQPISTFTTPGVSSYDGGDSWVGLDPALTSCTDSIAVFDFGTITPLMITFTGPQNSYAFDLFSMTGSITLEVRGYLAGTLVFSDTYRTSTQCLPLTGGWSGGRVGGPRPVFDTLLLYGDGSPGFQQAAIDNLETTDAGQIALEATATCIDNDLRVNIAAGDGLFNITATRGAEMPLSDVNLGVYTFAGPDWWRDVTVTETSGDGESINLGDFNCGVPSIQVLALESPIQTSESGDTTHFNVWLSSVPEASVNLPITISDPTEGTIPPTNLVFDDTNWDVPQLVIVTGVDDAIVDGDILYQAIIGPTISDFEPYNDLGGFGLPIFNQDNDSADIVVTLLETPLETSEAGDTAQFTVALTTEVLVDVTVIISSDNLAEGIPDVASLAFNMSNWHIPQTVTMTGIDDDVADGDIVYNAVIGPIIGIPSIHASEPITLPITNLDDDTAGFLIAELEAPMQTSEAGDTAQFTITLNSEPLAEVIIPISSDDITEGVPDVASVSFDSANWMNPQTVTITGVNDDIVDGDITYHAVLSTASGGADYDGLDPDDLPISNLDNDTAGIIVTSLEAPMQTSEAGDTAQFTIALNSEPLAEVIIPISSDNITEGVPDVASVSFDSTNWMNPQTVTITGVNDDIVDGDITYHAVLGPASGGADYNGLDPDDLPISNLDNDTAGIIVTSLEAPMQTSETGDTAQFTIALNSEPLAEVIIPISSDDITEGVPDVATVSFDSANWMTPQTVTITGVNDDIVDGDITYHAVLGPASGGADYNGLDPDDLPISNLDNDTAGIIVTSLEAPMQTSETGDTAQFTIALNSEPLAEVIIPISSDDITEGVPDVASVSFDSTNWMNPQTVTITGVNDDIVDGDITYHAVLGPASGGADYNGLDPDDLPISNLDNDTAGIIVTSLEAPMQTSETGDTAQFTIALNSEPLAEVIIPISSDDITEGLPDVASISFDSANWMNPQTVTITGVNDDIVDGDITYHAVLGPASGGADYNGLDPDDLPISNLDDESDEPRAELVVMPTTLLIPEHPPGQKIFIVRLGTPPALGEIVTITLTFDATQLTVEPAALVITDTNWHIPQTIRVGAVNDGIDEPVITYPIDLTASSSNGPSSPFDGLIAQVNATVFDNVAGIITFVPNYGLIQINVTQSQPAYQSPSHGVIRLGSDNRELILPYDWDDNGFDTYVVTDVRTYEGQIWLALWIGNMNWVWVPYDTSMMTEIQPIDWSVQSRWTP